jgi:hypothetical protein
MRKIIAIIAVAGMVSSCGVVNRVLKHKTSEVHLDQSSSSSKAEIKTEIVDNSVTTKTEKVDTTVTTKEVKGSSSNKVDLSALKDGLNIIDDSFIKLDQIYDPLDSTLKTAYVLKPQAVPVAFDRKTETKNDIKISKSDKSQQEQQKKKQDKKSEAFVERKPDYGVVFILIGVVLFLIFMGWLWRSGKLNDFLSSK